MDLKIRVFCDQPWRGVAHGVGGSPDSARRDVHIPLTSHLKYCDITQTFQLGEVHSTRGDKDARE